MKKLLPFLCVLIFFSSVNAQVEFPELGASWRVTRTHYILQQAIVQKFDLRSDSVVLRNGKYYFQVNYRGDFGDSLNAVCYYRKDANKVYLYQPEITYPYPLNYLFETDSGEFLLYDYDMLPGDSITYKLKNGSYETMKLDHIDTLENHQPVRRLFVFMRNNGGLGPTWYEGVGTRWGPFTAWYPYWEQPLLNACMKTLTDTVVFDENKCATPLYGLGINSAHKSDCRVYPNPAKDFLTVSGDVSELKVFDPEGKEISNLSYRDFTGDFQIDCRNLRDGIYYLVTMNAKGSIVQKLSVIH